MEREGYTPTDENLNDRMTSDQHRQFQEHMEGWDNIPFAIDENGDRVQPDRPMPEDEFDRKRREIEGQ